MEDTLDLARLGLLGAALAASPDIFMVTTLDASVVVAVNDAFVQATGYARAEALGRSVDELRLWVEDANREAFRARLKRDGRVHGLEGAIRLKGGKERRFELSASIGREGETSYVVTLGRDITDRVALEQSLRKSAFLLERAEEMAKIGSWEFDYATRQVTGSAGASRIYGVPRETFSMAAIEDIPLPEYRPLLDRTRDAHIREGKPYDIEFKIRRAGDGEILDIHSRALWDSANKRLFGIIRDITEERRAEASLRSALAEREILIQELYHRISNTLQTIISMLGLEKARDATGTYAPLVERMTRRVRSIALAHASLYESGKLSRVNLGEYLPRLLGEALGSAAANAGARIDYDALGVSLLIDAVVPVGIVVCELVDNALAHAFRAGAATKIRISAYRETDGTVSLAVSDDGEGFQDGKQPAERLGLAIVRNLIEGQLRGAIRYDGARGFACEARFRDDFLETRV